MLETIDWRDGKYTGELKEGIPHGKGEVKISYDDTADNDEQSLKGWTTFEGTFDRGNPVKGKMEVTYGHIWMDFNYYKNFNYEDHKNDKEIFSTVIFDGYWKQPKENLTYISHRVNRRYQGLEEIHWSEIEHAIYFRDKFGAVYSGPLSEKQYRPHGEGILKFPDGTTLKGNFISRAGVNGIFEGKITYPGGKIKEMKDDRSLTDQFKEWFWE